MENKFIDKIKNFKLPFYVTKKIGLAKWKYWLFRVGGFLLAFLISAIVCTIIVPGSFGTFFAEVFKGTFGDMYNVVKLLITFSLILMISLALAPAFKMKFWNIGAEGQILAGALVAAGIARFCPTSMPNFVVLILACVGAMFASIIWSVIPAIFKAFFNTNETLFTLMMNYIAAILSALMISLWVKTGTQSFGVLHHGIFPELLEHNGTLVIVFGVITFVAILFYLRSNIHGYEIRVVGESLKTARYVGINVKKVIIRTLILTGSIMGFIGFCIVCGIETSFNDSIVGGKGFTGVLIAWLGHFEPFEIALYSFLNAFMEIGTKTAATAVKVSGFYFSSVCTGIFFIVVIATEFFSNYQIKMHKKEKVIASVENIEVKGDGTSN